MTFTRATIRKLRHALGLTQESFAHEVGVSVSQVSRWESGLAKPSRLAQRRLAEIQATQLSAREVA